MFENRRGLLIALLLGGSFLGMLGFWEAQAYSMKREFVRVLLRGPVDGTPILMRDKVWTEAELRRARVVKVPRSAGKQQALLRLAHVRNFGAPTPFRYGYEAAVTDAATGIRHVYGRFRDRPGVWVYVSLHPDSAALYIQQRDQMIEQYQNTPVK